MRTVQARISFRRSFPHPPSPVLVHGGIDSALALHGLAGCRALGVDAVVVLGHSGYSPRFAFEHASRFLPRCEYDVPDEVSMALDLSPARCRTPEQPAYYRGFPR